MPAINFQPQFAELVKKGEKCQTIRQKRKNKIKPGDTLHMFTGLRTKKCQKILEVTCKEVQEVVITEGSVKCKWYPNLDPYQIHTPHFFARRDGFSSWAQMRDWFKKQYGLPFKGVVIKW